MKKLQKYRLIIIAALLYLLFFLFKKDIFVTATHNTVKFFVEMLQVLPPVLILSALITVWVPSDVIKKGFGHQSGLKGKLLSLFIGSISAGPIYAAFPAVLVLFKKGASISNIVIILSAWAVVKIPMIFVEISFLGIKFALTRVMLTLPAILFMGYLVEKFVDRKNVEEAQEEVLSEKNSPKKSHKEILHLLPNLNCGACGYDNCTLFAKEVFKGNKHLDQCVILQKQAKESSNA